MVVEKEKKKVIKPLLKKVEKVSTKKTAASATKTKKKVEEETSVIDVKKISDSKVKIVKKETEPKKKTNQKLDGRSYATGKRKNAIAKVWLAKGTGNIKINGMDALSYLKRPILEVIINTPFVITNTAGKFDIICSVIGGGLSGQAGAIKHGISKALLNHNPEAYRKDLKSAGLLTRDSRIVERKKPGLKKARKGQVFSKR